MRFTTPVRILSVLIVGLVVSACGSDSGRPTSLKQQQDAMHQPPPSAADLKDAMSKVHFKTPGSNNVQTPPAGTQLPGGK